ncbi:MAG TPA: 2-amino-4-hydroxy-6-hydroxymethyldihydropteridine diphosphokinase, partial [Lutibacter sp.]|nr:2-amino-4-hydroxy-6-hydroxymethyldihydropteridine diphosphokinase [Lutibacter sp.]
MQILRPTYLSLGSNQGNKLENLQQAIDLIAEKIGAVVKISSVYKTESWGFKSDEFFNICIQISTGLNPENLLKSIHEIEVFLGRKRASETGYKARTIDIDVLLFDTEIIISKELIV